MTDTVLWKLEQHLCRTDLFVPDGRLFGRAADVKVNKARTVYSEDFQLVLHSMTSSSEEMIQEGNLLPWEIVMEALSARELTAFLCRIWSDIKIVYGLE